MPALSPQSYFLDADVASGQTTSAGVYLGLGVLCGVYTPAEFDGTAITFQASPDGGTTWVPVHGADGTAVSVTVAASRYTRVDHALFLGVDRVKVVCGTSQTGASAIKVAARRV